jgi:hypothetical protein
MKITIRTSKAISSEDNTGVTSASSRSNLLVEIYTEKIKLKELTRRSTPAFQKVSE